MEERKMKILTLFAALMLSACATTDLPKLPPAPINTTTITVDRPVPVLCKVDIKKVLISIDTAQIKMKLEEQNAMLRASVAQQKKYITKLEAGVIGCGGKISNP
jgi:cell division protein FtsB